MSRISQLREVTQAAKAGEDNSQFAAYMQELKASNPTVSELKQLIGDYTGVPQKTGKKEDLYRYVEHAYNQEMRLHHRREDGTLPI